MKFQEKLQPFVVVIILDKCLICPGKTNTKSALVSVFYNILSW